MTPSVVAGGITHTCAYFLLLVDRCFSRLPGGPFWCLMPPVARAPVVVWAPTVVYSSSLYVQYPYTSSILYAEGHRRFATSYL